MANTGKTRVSVFIATSVDGFIARSDGDIAWLHEGAPPPEGEDFGYSALMDSVDLLVMGRRTFEKVLTFGDWPYQKPVLVLSRSLTKLPEHLKGKATLGAATPQELVALLKTQGIKHIYLDGGRLIQSFLKEGLVDDLSITRLPILLGQGLPLFGELTDDVHLAHVTTRSWGNGFVQSTYRVKKASAG